MGRWEYERVFDVDAGPFVGTVRVGYEKLIPLSGHEQPKAFPAWERMVIWKDRNSANSLADQTPHVNTDMCRRRLVRARLHGGGSTNLYLTDYTPGSEKVELIDKETLPDDHPIAGLPSFLVESDAEHARHPNMEERWRRVTYLLLSLYFTFGILGGAWLTYNWLGAQWASPLFVSISAGAATGLVMLRAEAYLRG